ncbi:MAG: D-glycero-beta-D-manno-heptose-7-phosphate kinase [Herpetosiphon sp.]|nr:D-glycero-beta-D-manno-heptose-7-phosphate kinase [Herpetosiphon sp.]
MANVRELLSQIGQRRMMIVGDVMLDEYIWGDVQRISPEAPVPIVNVQRRSYRPGGASNVAASIAAMNSTPLLAGVIGQDHAADHLRLALQRNHVQDVSGLIALADRPTTLKTRVIAHSQQMLRCDTEVTTPLSAEAETEVLRWVLAHLDGVDGCIVSDYAKGVLSAHVCQTLIRAARGRAIPVIIDPKGRDFQRYRGATVITPNVHELSVATAMPVATLAELGHAVQHLLTLLDGAAVIVTRSADGMALYQAQSEPHYIPALARTVYDVTGAGDTVVAMLALALASGATLETAMELATVAASVVIGKVGTATVTVDEIQAALDHEHVR